MRVSASDILTGAPRSQRMDSLLANDQGPRVLVVEDDPISAMLVERLFGLHGVDVDVSRNGREALEQYRERRYRLVVSDWMMPEINGVDLCREFRRIGGPYTYFILCTAKGQREDRIEAFDAGVDDFLTKPLDRDQLYARLKVAGRILSVEEDLERQRSELESSARTLSQMNSSLTLASRRFEELFNGLPVACFTFDRQGLIQEWNRSSHQIFGIEGFEAGQEPVWEVMGKYGDTWWTEDRVMRVFSQDSTPFDWTFPLADGSYRYLACNIICLRAVSGEVVGAVCANLDITDRKLAEQMVESQMAQINEYATQLAAQAHALEVMNSRLNHLAVTDGLTGLWNHRKFQEMLEEIVDQHKRTGDAFSLILCDVDHFKRFNDDFGHQVGDEVLKQVSAILQTNARSHEMPARYGGEEFAILLRHCDFDEAILAAERFRAAIRDADWQHRQVTASFGVATWPSGDNTGKNLIQHADEALYASKAAGRNRVTHYRQMRSAMTA